MANATTKATGWVDPKQGSASPRRKPGRPKVERQITYKPVLVELDPKAWDGLKSLAGARGELLRDLASQVIAEYVTKHKHELPPAKAKLF